MSHNSPTPFPSLPTLYPIPLTQSVVNTNSPTPSLPTIYPIPLTQSAVNTQFPYRKLCCFCMTKMRTSTQTDQRCDDHVDRKSYSKCPQLKPNAHCVFAAFSGTPCSTVQLPMSYWFKCCTNY